MRPKPTYLAALAIAFTLTASFGGAALAATDKREMQAREDFAAGRYQDALDIFVKLYAEKLHPNYLRNIGRCYQNLGEPDKAISSFREYLRKAKGVSADERAEVEGYIKEMEALAATQKQGQGAPPPEPPPHVTPLPIVAATAATTGTGAGTGLSTGNPPPAMTLQATPPPPAAEESSPFYKTWWFWTIVGGVAVAGAGLAAAGVFTSKKDAACDTGRVCP